jgi:MFS transporter, PPP family, 3-phenylpropionic acid transporter
VTRLSLRARARLVYVALFAAVGAAAPYLVLYYQGVGLSLGQIGLVVGFGSVVALASGPAWGLLSDRRSGSPRVLAAAAACALLGTAGLALAHDLASVLASVGLYAAGFYGLSPIIDARALEVSGAERTGYGPLRAWGSLAYVISAAGTGLAVDRWGVAAPLVILAISLAVTALVGSTIGPPKDLVLGIGDGQRLRTTLLTPALGVFLVGAFLTFTALSGVQSFLSLRFAELGAPAATIGLAAGVGAAVEVPVMLRFPALIGRFGPEPLVVLGAAIFALRAFVNAATADPAILVLMGAIGGVGYACFVVGGVTYVSRHAPARLAATAQGSFTGLAMGLGQVVAGFAGGALAGSLGLTGLFLVSGVVAVLGSIVLARAVLARPAEQADVANPAIRPPA